jgi:hypothetical protein
MKKSRNSKNQGFSKFLLFDGTSWIRIRTNKLRILIRIHEAEKHTNPAPDSEHC